MITNNYYKLKAVVSANVIPPSTSQTFPANLTDISGNINLGVYGDANPGHATFSTENWALRTRLSMRVGNGNTEPTFDDYCLDSDCNSWLSNIQTTVNTGYEGNVIKTVITMSAINGVNELVIKEVGVFKGVYESGLVNHDILLVRELLEQPLTVPPGGSFSLTFAWEEG